MRPRHCRVRRGCKNGIAVARATRGSRRSRQEQQAQARTCIPCSDVCDQTPLAPKSLTRHPGTSRGGWISAAFRFHAGQLDDPALPRDVLAHPIIALLGRARGCIHGQGPGRGALSRELRLLDPEAPRRGAHHPPRAMPGVALPDGPDHARRLQQFNIAPHCRRVASGLISQLGR